jgi:putative endopeptidase
MKKITLIAASVALALSVSACSPEKQSNQTTIDEQVTAPLVSGIDLTALDSAVRPQDDLFRYTNGAWLANTEIPADKSRYSVFNELYDQTQLQLKAIIDDVSAGEFAPGSNEQKLGDFFNSYMNEAAANEAGLAPVKEELNQVAMAETHNQVAKLMASFARLGIKTPFSFWSSPDAKNPDVYAFYMNQSGLTLPDRDYYFKEDEKFENFRTATKEYITDTLTIAGHGNPSQAADNIFELEKQIADTHWTKVESRDANKTYNKVPVSELKAMLKGFDWDAYASEAGLDKLDSVVVRQLSYFENLGAVFADTELQTWKDYLAFRVVDEFASQMSEELVALKFGFYSKTLRGIPENQPRWKRAVNATSGALGEVLGQVYVKRHFKPEAKAKMEELVGNLVKAYGDSIKQLEWMSDETKVAALEKLSKFTPKVGYPDKWKDYSSLEIKADDLVGNYKRYAAFEYNRYIERLGKPVDNSEWLMTPQSINAYYHPVNNEIVFPAAILQPPFFNLEAEDAVNYGGIGAVIGHEIGHGFDDQGSKYDGDGNLRSWWTEQDREAFDKLGARLAAQYDQYSPLEGMNINGKLSLGENIGDMAGVTIGLKAYQMSLNGKESPVIDGLTGDQRFFMGWAQVWRSKYREDAMRAQLVNGPHSPGEFRANGAVVNSDTFHSAFETKEGDKMYVAPEDRTVIW